MEYFNQVDYWEILNLISRHYKTDPVFATKQSGNTAIKFYIPAYSTELTFSDYECTVTKKSSPNTFSTDETKPLCEQDKTFNHAFRLFMLKRFKTEYFNKLKDIIFDELREAGNIYNLNNDKQKYDVFYNKLLKEFSEYIEYYSSIVHNPNNNQNPNQRGE